MTDTDDLIRRLSDDVAPAVPLARTMIARLVPALAVAFVLLLVGWGLRPGLVAAWADPMALLKLLLPAGMAAAATLGALGLSRPDGGAGPARAILAALAVVALGLWGLSLGLTPPDGWGAALRGSTLVSCLLSIPTLAVLPTLALLLALRRGASLSPARSGALAGLGGGAAAAALYALHCPEDDPLFFVTWYGTGVLVATLAGALAGRRVLAW